MSAATWVVLGASSSIARAFALEAAGEGANVVLAGRDRDDLDRSAADIGIRHNVAVRVVGFDAEAIDTHDAFVARCVELAAEFGGGPLNVFLAFGLMPDQAAIDGDPDQAQRTIQATYAGAVSVLHRLAPKLEAQGKGHVSCWGRSRVIAGGSRITSMDRPRRVFTPICKVCGLACSAPV